MGGHVAGMRNFPQVAFCNSAPLLGFGGQLPITLIMCVIVKRAPACLQELHQHDNQDDEQDQGDDGIPIHRYLLATPPRRYHDLPVSRLYDPEPPSTVEVNDLGRPAALTWQRREPVREVVNRWRVDDDWWRVPISRMYWVVTPPTMLLEIYEDLRTGDWYLQRVID